MDVPRIFKLPYCQIVNKFHDKMRKIEYIRIMAMLKRDSNPAPSHHNTKPSYSIKNRLLDNIFTEVSIYSIKRD
jgi:hypothetical protein